jgi:hypothetical protein
VGTVCKNIEGRTGQFIRPAIETGPFARQIADRCAKDCEDSILEILARSKCRVSDTAKSSSEGASGMCGMAKEGVWQINEDGLCTLFASVALFWIIVTTYCRSDSVWAYIRRSPGAGKGTGFLIMSASSTQVPLPGQHPDDEKSPLNGLLRFLGDFCTIEGVSGCVGDVPYLTRLTGANHLDNPTFVWNMRFAYPDDSPNEYVLRVCSHILNKTIEIEMTPKVRLCVSMCVCVCVCVLLLCASPIPACLIVCSKSALLFADAFWFSASQGNSLQELLKKDSGQAHLRKLQAAIQSESESESTANSA